MAQSPYAPVFYEPSLSDSAQLLQLSQSESQHALQVLRVKSGDPCIVVNGNGLGRHAEVESVADRSLSLRLSESVHRLGEPKTEIILGLGLATNDRFDEAIAAGIEAGVSRFVPLICEKCRFSPSDEKSAKRMERWNRIAIAAMKQSRRSCLTSFDEPVAFESWVKSLSGSCVAFSPEGKETLSTLSGEDKFPEKVSILIGPVAGFSEREVALLETTGVPIVTLGERILRFETAVPVATALVLAAFGEYSRG